MNKKTEYALKGAGIVGLGGIIFNAIKQLMEMNDNPEKKFDWGEMFTTGLKGAAIGAGGGFLIGATKDHFNELEKPINTNAFIFSVIDDIKLKKTDKEYVRLSTKAAKIERLVNDYFRDKIQGHSVRRGSTEDGTALKEKFDIDIFFSFRAGSFSSNEEMYESLYSFLSDNYSDDGFVELRRQGRSIGVIFNIRGKEYKIDVVPCKLSSKGRRSSAGYLYVNDDSLFGKSSYTKTNIKKLDSKKLSTSQQKIFLLLKSWKNKNNVPLKSYLLKELIFKAYEANRGQIPRDITKKLMMVTSFIADNIIYINIKGVENTNNVLTDIPKVDKQYIKDACQKIIKDYEYQPNSLAKVFET